MTRIAINGFGRIGRLVLRRIIKEYPSLKVVAINDLMDPASLAYLLKHDSVYGKLGLDFFTVEADLENPVRSQPVGGLKVNGQSIFLYNETDPRNLPWEKLGVQIVVESTGRFTKIKDAQKHLEAGAKKVLISANSPDADISLVMGVNEKKYNSLEHQVISGCSCTTNCAAPVLKILDDNFGVEKAVLTTVHAVTASQSLVDTSTQLSVNTAKKDLREGRAAFQNIIPSSTGASEAVEKVLPKLKGRIIGSAYRVPVIAGSILEVVVQTKKETFVEEVNRIFEEASVEGMKNILAVSREPLVSSDIIGRSEAAIVDLPLTQVVNLPKIKDKNLVKVVAWYDNEYGYACRLAELVEYIAKKL